MKRKFIHVLVFLYLFIGGCDINCGKGPTQVYDLVDASISNDLHDGNNWIQDVQEASFDELRIFLVLEFDRIASLSFRSNYLYALDCFDPTIITNEIVNVEITTNYDINESYLAGDNINDIALTNGGHSTLKDILLTNNYQLLHNLEIIFEEIPLVGSKFSLTLIITLKDGTQITAVSNDVTII
ncbi:MAG: hypothetical protein OEX22_03230 [Cyclobacteriaceae bacterium]|nr:hypothetical protein [Cyclobacteriaceae bacterium]